MSYVGIAIVVVFFLAALGVAMQARDDWRNLKRGKRSSKPYD